MAINSSPSDFKLKGLSSTSDSGNSNTSLIEGPDVFKPASSKNKLKALVVDDTKLSRLYMTTLLKNVNIISEEAVDGRAALNCFLEGKTYDLILMDKDMPGMNGVEATKALREMGVTAKIVGITGRSSDEDRREFLEAGVDEFRMKPLTTPQLIELLQDFGKQS